ncbi:MAG TPA: hypothetical protein VF796_24110, partial [Humisphaera sp.]
MHGRWVIDFTRARNANSSGRRAVCRAARAGRVLRLACWLAAPCLPALLPAPAAAQYQAPGDKLFLTAKSADTWAAGDTDVVLLEGPVTIELERATLSAKQAVVWLSPENGPEANRQRVQVVLVGDAKVTRDGVVRSGDRMLVNGSVAGRVRLTADERAERDRSTSDLYRTAEAVRNPAPATPAPMTPAPVTQQGARPAPGGPAVPAEIPAGPATRAAPTTAGAEASGPAVPWAPRVGPASGPAPSTRPATTTSPTTLPEPVPMPAAPVVFDAQSVDFIKTDDGTIAAVLDKGVRLIHRRPNGDVLEMSAARGVVFTPLRDLQAAMKDGGVRAIQDAVTGAYLEDDVKVVFTPAAVFGEQRLEARRAYYEFATDRAILTDAIVRTIDLKSGIPFRVRADTVRQLARGEFTAEGAEVSTSQFANPSYSLRAEKVYVRQDHPGDATAASIDKAQTVVQADNATFRAFGVPFFYLPRVGANISEYQSPLRSIGFEQSQVFGTSGLTEWGLFQTFGVTPPKDLDAAYRLDYFGDRGPAAG